MSTGVSSLLRALALPASLLALAEVWLRASGYSGDAIALPSDVALACARALIDGTLVLSTAQTIGAAMLGLLFGGGLGVLAGVWFGLSRSARHLSVLSIELLRPVPSVALIPLAMLLFGFGVRMETSVVSFACFWPMLLLTQAAVRQVEPRLFEVARLLGLAPIERMLKLVLPAAAPRIFVALRISVGVALVVAVTVEIAANPYGLGYLAITSQQNLRPDLMLATVAWIGLIGWALNRLLVRVQTLVFATHARTLATVVEAA